MTVQRTDAVAHALEELAHAGHQVRTAEAGLHAAIANRDEVARRLWPELHHLGPTTIAHEIGNVISGAHLRILTQHLLPRPRRGPTPRGVGRPTAEDCAALEELRCACVAVVEAYAEHARALDLRTATIRLLWPVLQPLGAARVARELGPDVIGEATIRSATADLQRRGRL